jgi:hypothetical protein
MPDFGCAGRSRVRWTCGRGAGVAIVRFPQVPSRVRLSAHRALRVPFPLVSRWPRLRVRSTGVGMLPPRKRQRVTLPLDAPVKTTPLQANLHPWSQKRRRSCLIPGRCLPWHEPGPWRVLRAAYFRYGVSKAVSSAIDAFTWGRLMSWIRAKYSVQDRPIACWRERYRTIVRVRPLCQPGQPRTCAISAAR